MSVSDHTAGRLVTAAEQLFAEGGEESTSLRSITRAAHCNAASVHYHFGGRDELLRAVLDRHLGPRSVRRFELLDQASSTHGQVVPVDVLADAAVRADLELLAALRHEQVQLARFLGRAHTLPGPPVAEFVERQFATFADRAVPLLHRTLPEVGNEELRRRLRLVGSMVVALFAGAPDPGATGPLGTDDVDEQVRRLAAFCAAGLAAPSGDREETARFAGQPMPRRADRAATLVPPDRPSRHSEPPARVKPHQAKADSVTSGTTNSAKSGTTKSGTTKSGSAKSGTAKSGTAKSGSAKSGTTKADRVKAGKSKPTKARKR